jgi:hypothetical protein
VTVRVTKTLQGCSERVPRVLQGRYRGCYKGDSRVLQGRSDGVTSVFRGCYRSATSASLRYTRGVTRV